MEELSMDEIRKISEKVWQLAAQDDQFRELCKKDIHAAIQRASGEKVPQQYKINVIDNSGCDISVVLPPLQKADGELEEQELEQVAGGFKNFNHPEYDGQVVVP